MKDKISMGQMMCLVFLSLVSLGADLFPKLSTFGSGAYLAPLLLLVVTVPVAYVLGGRIPREKEASFGEKMLAFWHSGMGKIVAILVLLWSLFLLAIHGTRATLRIVTAEGEPVFFGMILLILALVLVRGKLSSFARSGEIFLLIIVASLLGVSILALPAVELSHIALVTKGEMLAMPSFSLGILGYASVVLVGFSFAHEITGRESNRRHCIWGLVWTHLAVGLVLALILGVFGSALSGHIDQPFFQMVASLGTEGSFQRLEALVSAIWILGDLTLLALLLFGIKSLGKISFGVEKPFVLSALFALISFGMGGYFLSHSDLYEWLMMVVVPGGGLLFLLIMLLIYIKVGGENVAKKAEDKNNS